MQVCMRPIEMIASCRVEGVIRPRRLKLPDRDDTIVINVDRILTISEEKLGGCLRLQAQYGDLALFIYFDNILPFIRLMLLFHYTKIIECANFL